jgi:hypothetical protein
MESDGDKPVRPASIDRPPRQRLQQTHIFFKKPRGNLDFPQEILRPSPPKFALENVASKPATPASGQHLLVMTTISRLSFTCPHQQHERLDFPLENPTTSQSRFLNGK